MRTPARVIDAQRDRLVRVAVDYTLTQATWSADTYVAQRARLAELATGPALAQLAPRDGQPPAAVAAQLTAARSSSRASLIGTDGPTRRHEVVVVYKVRATGSGRSADRRDYQVGAPHAHPQTRPLAGVEVRDRAMSTAAPLFCPPRRARRRARDRACSACGHARR